MPETNSNNLSASGGQTVVAGAAGLIGSRVVASLVARDLGPLRCLVCPGGRGLAGAGSAAGEPAKVIADSPPSDADCERAVRGVAGSARGVWGPDDGLSVVLLTGGHDRSYTFGLATALAAAGVPLEIVGGDQVDRPEFHCTPGIKYRNLRGGQDPNRLRRALVVGVYYLRLIRYAVTARPKIFHVLWNNRIEGLDRTILTLCYRLLGKRVVLTAHNVNQAARDGRDSFWNRLTLRIQYRLADVIFVHTEAMAQQLRTEFGVGARAIVTVPFGVDDSVPVTALTGQEARGRLGLNESDRVLLFFGQIRHNKGLEYLARAFVSLAVEDARYRLVIAGEPRRDAGAYLAAVRSELRAAGLGDRVIDRAEHVPDAEAEVFFKAADVLVLPYREVFQSGVLFLGLGFGLPAVATAVGGLASAVVEGKNGMLCRPQDAASLAAAIRRYFSSGLYAGLAERRADIAREARETNSWAKVAEITRNAYRRVRNGERSVRMAERGGGEIHGS